MTWNPARVPCMTRPWSRRWPVLILALAVGCVGDVDGEGGAEETMDGATVTLSDSAGVQVLENITPAWDEDGPEWVVSDSPRVRIGSVDDTLTYLAGVRGVAVGPRGEIAVGNRTLDDVRAFSAEGAPLWRQGRRGEGPGEYQYIVDVRSCGDYILVRDPDLRRLTFLNWAGEVEGVRDYGEGSEVGATSALDCNAHGQFAQLHRTFPAEGPSGSYMANAVLFVGDLLSGERRIVLDAPGFQRHRLATTDVPADLGKRTLVATGGSLVHVITTDRAEVRSYGLNGDLVRVARWPVAPKGITTGLLEELAARRAEVLPESMRTEYKRQWLDLPHPEELSFVDELVLSSTGDLWLRRFDGYVERSEETQWWVFSAAGAWRGSVTLPAGFQLMSVTTESVVGLTRDELNVEYVEIRRIHRGS